MRRNAPLIFPPCCCATALLSLLTQQPAARVRRELYVFDYGNHYTPQSCVASCVAPLIFLPCCHAAVCCCDLPVSGVRRELYLCDDGKDAALLPCVTTLLSHSCCAAVCRVLCAAYCAAVLLSLACATDTWQVCGVSCTCAMTARMPQKGRGWRRPTGRGVVLPPRAGCTTCLAGAVWCGGAWCGVVQCTSVTHYYTTVQTSVVVTASSSEERQTAAHPGRQPGRLFVLNSAARAPLLPRTTVLPPFLCAHVFAERGPKGR